MNTDPTDLIGHALHNGWTIIKYLPRSPIATGGAFSIAYEAEHTSGTKGFVKVLNFAPAMSSPDPSRALQPLIDAFEFERQMLEECQDLSRIVTAIDNGTIVVGLYPIQYLIFEIAEGGDARRQRALSTRFDGAWCMRTLHGTTNAIQQLHSRSIVHQDLKPSNVLIFGDNDARVGDLGRSCHQHRASPHDHLPFPGDFNYAPPEYLYGATPTTWSVRRLATDLYLIGSFACFLLNGVPMTEFLESHLAPEHRAGTWSESYANVLPYLVDAQQHASSFILSTFHDALHPTVAHELEMALLYLCHPDPEKRGHPTNRRRGSPYGLERFVSLFDRLASLQELHVRRALTL